MHKLGRVKTYTDYQHATIMINPIPTTNINILCEHKLKEDYLKACSEVTSIDKNIYNNASGIIFPQLISAFQYKNFIGTQSHPFKHAKDERVGDGLRKATRNFIQASLGLDNSSGNYYS